ITYDDCYRVICSNYCCFSPSRHSYATWCSNNRPNTRNWTCSYNIRFTLWYTFSNSLSYNRCNWCTCFRTVYRRAWYSAWTDRWFFNRIHSYYSFHGILLRKNKFYIKNALIANIIGMFITLIFGTIWLKFISELPWSVAIAGGFTPFLIGGFIKAFIAAYAGIIVRDRLKSAQLLPATN